MAAMESLNEKATIEGQPWHELRIYERQLIVKSLFSEGDGSHVILSDLASVWEEKLEATEVMKRLKALNPSVEVPYSVLLNHLSKALSSPQASTKYRLSHDRSCDTPASTPLTLSLSTTLSSLPFQWKFECLPAAITLLSAHLITPLVCVVGELLRRQSHLAALLKRKDRELQDYKDHGARLSRKHLETTAFDEENFLSGMRSDDAFTTSTLLPLATLSNERFLDLYKEVAAIRSNQVEDEDRPPSPTQPSHPHTLTPPPNQSLETTPKKDNEDERREMLEKKLEEEKLKPKKKKKKLM